MPLNINKLNLWLVTARIIGAEMPKNKLKINNCIIEKMSAEEQEKLVLLPRRPSIDASGDQECYMRYITDDNKFIKSNYFISTQVSAKSSIEAENEAEKKFSYVIDIISFGAKSENWYEYSLCGINRITNRGVINVESVASFGVRTPYNLSPKIISEQEIENFEYLLKVKNEIFNKALCYLSTAEKRLNTDLIRGKDRLEVDVFLNFFKVIELISNEITNKEKFSIDEELLEKLLNDFKNDFEKTEDLSKQVSVMEKYQNDISILKAKYLSEKIKKAGALLKLEKEFIDSVLNFNIIRNRYDVSHAHTSRSDIKIDWAELSKTSRNFLHKYLKEYKLI